MIATLNTAFARSFKTLGLAVFALFAALTIATPATAQVRDAGAANADVRALFASWQQDERQRAGVMAIPSGRPVEGYRLTSSFGTRNDPFGAGRRRHNGLDMAGPIGTPIYATADGIVGRAQWVRGYGKYVEINHGSEIQTRYGHMSEILVQPGSRVERGELIGRMGSTGRSTGSHLHYEVRVEGVPVNPTPFLTSAEYLASLPVATTAALDTSAPVGASH
ncbi:M23 family metallopeptidase [Parasphingopyxis marina]|uniref:M23 family metallopeptidase n=1 Tax=Parasphingopyxis marina TaxID=2761622 RepID=A0A842HYJ4_9SPHN|nr:M23 family metallopeptidase [Parasphingopyxis marina]MBC2776990.1 M23 family metallopeptidase [Parasphingopyxis marina]